MSSPKSNTKTTINMPSRVVIASSSSIITKPLRVAKKATPPCITLSPKFTPINNRVSPKAFAKASSVVTPIFSYAQRAQGNNNGQSANSRRAPGKQKGQSIIIQRAPDAKKGQSSAQRAQGMKQGQSKAKVTMRLEHGLWLCGLKNHTHRRTHIRQTGHAPQYVYKPGFTDKRYHDCAVCLGQQEWLEKNALERAAVDKISTARIASDAQRHHRRAVADAKNRKLAEKISQLKANLKQIEEKKALWQRQSDAIEELWRNRTTVEEKATGADMFRKTKEIPALQKLREKIANALQAAKQRRIYVPPRPAPLRPAAIPATAKTPRGESTTGVWRDVPTSIHCSGKTEACFRTVAAVAGLVHQATPASAPVRKPRPVVKRVVGREEAHARASLLYQQANFGMKAFVAAVGVATNAFIGAHAGSTSGDVDPIIIRANGTDCWREVPVDGGGAGALAWAGLLVNLTVMVVMLLILRSVNGGTLLRRGRADVGGTAMTLLLLLAAVGAVEDKPTSGVETVVASAPVLPVSKPDVYAGVSIDDWAKMVNSMPHNKGWVFDDCASMHLWYKTLALSFFFPSATKDHDCEHGPYHSAVVNVPCKGGVIHCTKNPGEGPKCYCGRSELFWSRTECVSDVKNERDSLHEYYQIQNKSLVAHYERRIQQLESLNPLAWIRAQLRKSVDMNKFRNSVREESNKIATAPHVKPVLIMAVLMACLYLRIPIPATVLVVVMACFVIPGHASEICEYVPGGQKMRCQLLSKEMTEVSTDVQALVRVTWRPVAIVVTFLVLKNPLMTMIVIAALYSPLAFGDTCTSSATSTLVGSRYYDGLHKVDLTSGELNLVDGLCLTFNVQQDGKTKTHMYHFSDLTRVTRKIAVYKVVDKFYQGEVCTWKCVLHTDYTPIVDPYSAIKNIKQHAYVAMVCPEVEKAVHSSLCTFGTYLVRCCAIYWGPETECTAYEVRLDWYRVHLKHAVDGVKTFDSTVKIQKGWNNYGPLKYRLADQTNEKPTKWVVCGSDTYEFNADFEMPDNVITYQFDKQPDLQAVERSMAWPYNQYEPCGIHCSHPYHGFRSVVPNVMLRHTNGIKTTEIVSGLTIGVQVEGVLQELPECQNTVGTWPASVVPTIMGKIIIPFTMTAKNAPCLLHVAPSDQGACSLNGMSQMINDQEGSTGVLVGVCEGATKISIPWDKNTPHVTVEARETWSYVKNAIDYVAVKTNPTNEKSWWHLASYGNNIVSDFARRATYALAGIAVGYLVFMINPFAGIIVFCALAFGIAKADAVEITTQPNGGLFDWAPTALGAAGLVLYMACQTVDRKQHHVDTRGLKGLVLVVIDFLAWLCNAWRVFAGPWGVAALIWSGQSETAAMWGMYLIVSDALWKECIFVRDHRLTRTKLGRMIVDTANTIGEGRIGCAAMSLGAWLCGEAPASLFFSVVTAVLWALNASARGNRLFVSMHCVFPELFDNRADVMYSNYEAYQEVKQQPAGTCEFSSQVSEWMIDREHVMCKHHNGMSGTFDSDFRYINATWIGRDGPVCGVPPKGKDHQKNVIYDSDIASQQKSRMLRNLSEDSINPLSSPQAALIANTIEGRANSYVSMEVEYGWFQKVAAQAGLECGFDKLVRMSEHCLSIFQITSPSSSRWGSRDCGFGFTNGKGGIYSCYHVTKGRPLVVPNRNSDGEYQLTVAKCADSDSECDYAAYGNAVPLEEPTVGDIAYVVNPILQQAIFFRYQASREEGHGHVHQWQRISLVKDPDTGLMTVVDNCYTGHYGWSGLPMVSFTSGNVVGVYGFLRDRSLTDGQEIKYMESFGSRAFQASVDWEAKARETLDGGDDPLEVATCTGSGKSTLYPLAIAKEMLHRNETSGLIVVANPLRAVPPGLKSYMEGIILQDGLQAKIEVHYSIGQMSSASAAQIAKKARTNIVILYVSYGKYMTEMTKYEPRVLLADECHVQAPEVKVLLTMMEQTTVYDRFRKVKKARMSATAGVIIQRHIHEIAVHNENDGTLLDRKLPGFRFSLRDHCPNDSKVLIFVATKQQCHEAYNSIHAQDRTLPIFVYYSGYAQALQSIEGFNTHPRAVMIATNAIENGITLEGVDRVFDTQTEYTSILQPDLSQVLIRRRISKAKSVQRAGRAGRTTRTAFYYYPERHDEPEPLDDYNPIVDYDAAALMLAMRFQKPDGGTIEECMTALEDCRSITKAEAWNVARHGVICPATWAQLAFVKKDGTFTWSTRAKAANFDKAIKEGLITMAKINQYFPTAEGEMADFPPGSPHWFGFDGEQDEKHGLLEVATVAGVAFSGFVVASEVLARQRGFAIVTAVWAIPSSRWNCLFWGCQYDFVLGYDMRDLQALTFNAQDPHLAHNNRLLSATFGREILNSRGIDHKLTMITGTDEGGSKAMRICITALGSVVSRWYLTTLYTAAGSTPPRDCMGNVTCFSSGFGETGFVEYLEHPEIGKAKYPFVPDPDRELVEPDYHLYLSNFPLPSKIKPASKDSSEQHSMPAAAAAAQKWGADTVARLIASNPELVTAVMGWATGGGAVSSTISVVWDRMSESLGEGGAMATAALALACVSSPECLLTNVVSSVLTYSMKVVAVGTTNGVHGPTPPKYMTLGAAVGAGTLLASLRTDVPRQAIGRIQPIMLGGQGATGTNHASIVCCVKHFYRMCRAGYSLVVGGQSNGSEFLTTAFAFLNEAQRLNVIQVTATMVAGSIAVSLYYVAKNNRRVAEAVARLSCRDPAGVDQLADNIIGDEIPMEFIDWALSIATIVVCPSTSISVAMMTAWRILEDLIIGNNVTPSRAGDTLKQSFLHMSGVPVWICCSEILYRIIIIMFAYAPSQVARQNPPAPGNQQHSASAFSVLAGVTAFVGGASTMFGMTDWLKGKVDEVQSEGVGAALRDWCIEIFNRCAGAVVAIGKFLVSLLNWACGLFKGEWLGVDERVESLDMFAPDCIAPPQVERSTTFVRMVLGDHELDPSTFVDAVVSLTKPTLDDRTLLVIANFARLSPENYEKGYCWSVTVTGAKQMDLTVIKDLYEELSQYPCTDFSTSGCAGESTDQMFRFASVMSNEGMYIMIHAMIRDGIETFLVIHVNGGMFNYYLPNVYGDSKVWSFACYQALNRMVTASLKITAAVCGGRARLVPYKRKWSSVKTLVSYHDLMKNARLCLGYTEGVGDMINIKKIAKNYMMDQLNFGGRKKIDREKENWRRTREIDVSKLKNKKGVRTWLIKNEQDLWDNWAREGLDKFDMRCLCMEAYRLIGQDFVDHREWTVFDERELQGKIVDDLSRDGDHSTFGLYLEQEPFENPTTHKHRMTNVMLNLKEECEERLRYLKALRGKKGIATPSSSDDEHDSDGNGGSTNILPQPEVGLGDDPGEGTSRGPCKRAGTHEYHAGESNWIDDLRYSLQRAFLGAHKRVDISQEIAESRLVVVGEARDEFDACIYGPWLGYDPVLRPAMPWTNQTKMEVEDMGSMTTVAAAQRSGAKFCQLYWPNTIELALPGYCEMADADRRFKAVFEYELTGGRTEYRTVGYSAATSGLRVVVDVAPECSGVAQFFANHMERCEFWFPKQCQQFAVNTHSRVVETLHNPNLWVVEWKNGDDLDQRVGDTIVFTRDATNPMFWFNISKMRSISIHVPSTATISDLWVFVRSKRGVGTVPSNFNYIRNQVGQRLLKMLRARAGRQRLYITYPPLATRVVEWSILRGPKDSQAEKARMDMTAWAMKKLQLGGGTDRWPAAMLEFAPCINERMKEQERMFIRGGFKDADRCPFFDNQPILATYAKNDRLQRDYCQVMAHTHSYLTKNYWWNVQSSTVVQVSRSKEAFLRSTKNRADRPMFKCDPAVMAELKVVAFSIRSEDSTKFEPWDLDTCAQKITNGAVGMWDKHKDIRTTMEDPTEIDQLKDEWLRLMRGDPIPTMYQNWHNKVEAKIVADFDKEDRNGPRAINFGSAHQRINDFRCFGPFVQHHYNNGKLFKHATGGTPITEIGDKMHRMWEKWEKKGYSVRGATGDASKWDHSLYPELMALECEWVSSWYEPKWWPVVVNLLRHVCWPIVYTKMGFCFSNPGHRPSGHIFTWMNSFLNATLHEWAWKKTLGLPLDADLDEWLNFGVDGDDVFFIGPEQVVNEENMEKVRGWMKKANITIRSGTTEGYRVWDKFTDIDYLSHTYAPVVIACDRGHPAAIPPSRKTGPANVFRKWHRVTYLPIRDVAHILGKLVYTMKNATMRDTLRIKMKERAGEQLTAEEEEAVLVESSKLVSYVLTYPHLVTVRSTCLAILSNLGFAGGLWAGDSHWTRVLQERGIMKEDRSSAPGHEKLLGALRSVYGKALETLDDIGFVDRLWEAESFREHCANVVTRTPWGTTQPPKMLVRCSEEWHSAASYIASRRVTRMVVDWALTQAGRYGCDDVLYPGFLALWNPTYQHYRWALNVKKFNVSLGSTWRQSEQESSFEEEAKQMAKQFVRGVSGKVYDVLGYLKAYTAGEDTSIYTGSSDLQPGLSVRPKKKVGPKYERFDKDKRREEKIRLAEKNRRVKMKTGSEMHKAESPPQDGTAASPKSRFNIAGVDVSAASGLAAVGTALAAGLVLRKPAMALAKTAYSAANMAVTAGGVVGTTALLHNYGRLNREVVAEYERNKNWALRRLWSMSQATGIMKVLYVLHTLMLYVIARGVSVVRRVAEKCVVYALRSWARSVVVNVVKSGNDEYVPTEELIATLLFRG